jgi:hypothetical protein
MNASAIMIVERFGNIQRIFSELASATLGSVELTVYLATIIFPAGLL